MRSVYQYADISEADSKKGQIRCDVNVSIMEADKDENDPANWGTKIEIKNVNSFGGVRDAINYEIKRQIALKNSGEYENMPQQTRRWDEDSGTTIYMRSKVNAIDYKYFVEPNIPKYKITKDYLESIRKTIPMLALERKEKYIKDYGLSEYDANILIKDKEVSDYFNKCVELGIDAKIASNWVTVQVLGYLNKYNKNINDIFLIPERLVFILKNLLENKISVKQAKDVFYKVIDENIEPQKLISTENSQISDIQKLTEIIENILTNNEKQVNEYKAGKNNLFDFFVGQVMKETRGKANPNVTKDILLEKLQK